MRRFAVVASVIVSSVACVNLDKPEKVADCSMGGTCINGKHDAATVAEADASDDAWPVRGDVADTGGGTTADLAETSDGVAPPADVTATDAPMGGADGRDNTPDALTSDRICSAGGAPKPAGTPCRPAVDRCDVTEVCDGISLDCPPDKIATASTACRPVAGDCDIAETCDGSSTACPVDGFRAAGTICRPAAGICDLAESCDGTSAACPPDSLAPSTTVCRASTDDNQCDPSEKCSGSVGDCPSDVKYSKPTSPTGVAAVGGTLQVAISWIGSAGATGYNIKQSTTAGGGYTTVKSSPTTTSSPYADKGLVGGKTYYYVVSAINTIPTCESADSAEVSAQTTGTCVAPAAPVITATAGSGSVTLSWTAVAGAVSYTVARSQTSGTGYATVGTVATGSTYTDGNVLNGVTYYYVVTASNGSCASANSNEALAAPACVPPAAPAGVTATPGDGTVTLKWTASAGALSYSIYRRTDTEPLAFVNSTTQATFTDSRLTNGTTYYYVVQASSGSCASADSTAVSVKPACIPPATPTGIVVTPGDKQLTLSWAAPTGATQYRVSRGSTGTGTFTVRDTPSTTNYTDVSLTNGTTYYYVVAAGNGSCWSADSSVASGTPVCIPPAVPGTLSLTPGQGQISLSWAAAAGASEYTVWRKASAQGTYAQLATSTTTSYIDKTVGTDTYYYKISASNGSCSSDYGGEQSATPVPVCAQTPATNVKAAASGSVQITITWDAATPQPTTYAIERSATSGTGYISVGSVPGTATPLTYTDTDRTLVKNTTYYYQVTANGSCSATAPEVSATTACSALTAPVLGIANANGAITVTWPPIDGATTYTVYRSDSSNGPYVEVSSGKADASYTDPATNLINGNTYHYKVSASNANGQCVSSQSNEISTMSCAPPAVPVGLAASVGTSGQAKLTWTASSGATQYTILRGTTSGGEVAVKTSSTNSDTDTGLVDWTKYYYTVSAQNGTNNACSSAPSAEITATPAACPVLPAATAGYQADGVYSSYCIISCWDLAGVGISNSTGRNLTINGIAMTCPADGGNCTMPASLPKDSNGAYTFHMSAGSINYSAVYWWGTGHDCP